MDIHGNVTFFNEFAESFFGFSSQEILGKNVVGTIVPPADSSGRDLAEMIRDLIRSPERYVRNENENLRRNGERVWVLWTNKTLLDADEQVSRELGEEILQWKEDPSAGVGGYYIPRLTFFMGRWIRHTSWYPDFQLRLFQRQLGEWRGGRVHESFSVQGPTRRLSGNILHYTYGSMSEYLKQPPRPPPPPW